MWHELRVPAAEHAEHWGPRCEGRGSRLVFQQYVIVFEIQNARVYKPGPCVRVFKRGRDPNGRVDEPSWGDAHYGGLTSLAMYAHADPLARCAPTAGKPHAAARVHS